MLAARHVPAALLSQGSGGGGREKNLSGSGKFCLSLDGSLLSGKLICKLELEIFWQNGI